jgi:hypothetical protein
MAEHDDEIDAMRAIQTALEPLGQRARVRALWWSLSKLCPSVPTHVTDRLLDDNRGRGLDTERADG